MGVLAEAIRFAMDKEAFVAGTVNSGVIQIVEHSGIYYDDSDEHATVTRRDYALLLRLGSCRILRRCIGDTDSLHGGWSFAGKASKRDVAEFLVVRQDSCYSS